MGDFFTDYVGGATSKVSIGIRCGEDRVVEIVDTGKLLGQNANGALPEHSLLITDLFIARPKFSDTFTQQGSKKIPQRFQAITFE
jgi:hypothetical protein